MNWWRSFCYSLYSHHSSSFFGGRRNTTNPIKQSVWEGCICSLCCLVSMRDGTDSWCFGHCILSWMALVTFVSIWDIDCATTHQNDFFSSHLQSIQKAIRGHDASHGIQVVHRGVQCVVCGRSGRLYHHLDRILWHCRTLQRRLRVYSDWYFDA